MARQRRRPGSDSPPGDRGARRQFGAAFVLLVGFSGAMMAVQGGASVTMIGLTTVGGLLAGGALVWYLFWIAG
ncbi:hypothetical protein [Halobiforma nitratireducens]|uniref:hypothetical protein n=1 Tax=Halobiforma nitratireducens TaxID=130048 RepID=UPI00067803AA|nr:hypothetical protein [Halobiforma nitratireducens]